MPTEKPRITATLNQVTYDVIDRLAFLQGRSRGAVIAELLDAVAPALTRTVALLEAAAAAPDHVKRGLVEVVESVHGELSELAGDAHTQMDFLMSKMTGTEAGVDPHIVIRGSGGKGSPKPKAKKSLKNNVLSSKKAPTKNKAASEPNKRKSRG